jgi:hypothetical protein
MLAELEAIDTSPIEELQALKAEQLTLKERLDRMTAMKDQVSPEVYTRVRKDYEGRFAALEGQARPLLAKAREQYARLKAVMAELEQKLQAARLAKEEVEFRHALGEYTETQFAELLAQAQGEVAEVEAHLADANKLKERFLSAVLSEKELEGAAAPPKAPFPPPAEPAPPVESTAVMAPPAPESAPEEAGATIALAMPRLLVQTPEGPAGVPAEGPDNHHRPLPPQRHLHCRGLGFPAARGDLPFRPGVHDPRPGLQQRGVRERPEGAGAPLGLRGRDRAGSPGLEAHVPRP